MAKTTGEERTLRYLSDLAKRDDVSIESLDATSLSEKPELAGISPSTISEALDAFKKNLRDGRIEEKAFESSAGRLKKKDLRLKKSAVAKLKTAVGKAKKHTILVVDDEIENLRAVTSTLEEEYNILTAEDGQAGLELVQAHPSPEQVHMIISDQRMPRMTGVEFLEKTVPIIPKTIRIILTGFTDVDAIIDSINKGQVYKFITKPVDPKDLLVTVKRALEAFELDLTKTEVENRLIRCPQTRLYNRTYMMEYIKEEIKNAYEYNADGSVILLELDDISNITLEFGLSMLTDITLEMAYVLEQTADQPHFLFKLEGPAFAYYMPFAGMDAALDLAEKFRRSIETSDVFIKPVTVSVGVVSFREFFQAGKTPDVQSEVCSLAQQRLKIAHHSGNRVIHETGDLNLESGKVLIIDSDLFAAELLKQRLDKENFNVLICEDGEAGLNMIEKERPDVILTEIMLPKVDGFLIREKTMVSSDLRQIAFIVMSHLKDESAIDRANALRIEHYFQKPCIPAEIVGLIKTKMGVSG